ncbi:hypothetical protein IC620_15955 [Hazenella sp. IB182357]|uniref:Uncharacterized protein n=1 Tax=Polycladospora coralii TaxID=2771432 RepID=A0A926NHV5_9BACL|nr:hypothetical protein [Polycladospora coralii]MBD1373839.1 hypothetical protein [Polycladospora coralii]
MDKFLEVYNGFSVLLYSVAAFVTVAVSFILFIELVKAARGGVTKSIAVFGKGWLVVTMVFLIPSIPELAVFAGGNLLEPLKAILTMLFDAFKI